MQGGPAVKHSLMTMVFLSVVVEGIWVYSPSAVRAGEFVLPRELVYDLDAMPAASSSNEQTCEPRCRSDFVCLEGKCISRCNPPCPKDTVCTEDLLCVANKFGGSTLVKRIRRDRAREAEERREAAVNERLAYRLRPRITVNGLAAAFHLSQPALVGVSPAIGYRQNIDSLFGIDFQIGALWGSEALMSPDPSSDEDYVTIGEYYAEISPFISPTSGSVVGCYLGPILWGSYRTFNIHTVQTDSGKFYYLENGWRVGGGLEVGMLFLRREQLDVKLRFKFNFSGLKDVPRIETGVGYHFFL